MTYPEIRDKIGRPVRLKWYVKDYGPMSRSGIILAGTASKIIFSLLDDDTDEKEIVIRITRIEKIRILNSKRLKK